MCYEIYSNYNPDLTHLINPVQKANHGDTQHLLTNLDKIMQQTEYYAKKNPERIIRRLQKFCIKSILSVKKLIYCMGFLNKFSAN